MLRVDFTPDALKTLNSIPAKHARQVAEKVRQLAQDQAGLPIKELKGNEGFFRLKSGEYRIIYRVESDTLQIWLIGQRNDGDVYKRFERRR
jgi:mRNA interferase RelE/StbE